MTLARTNTSASSSPTHGYAAGGYTSGFLNNIDKFAFASSATGTDVGDTTVATAVDAGATSTTHGYILDHQTGGGVGNVIHKYSHTSDANATDIGDLTISKYGRVGTQF